MVETCIIIYVPNLFYCFVLQNTIFLLFNDVLNCSQNIHVLCLYKTNQIAIHNYGAGQTGNCNATGEIATGE